MRPATCRSLSALNALVSESIDVVVHARRTARGPRVTEIALVEDLAGGAEAAQLTVTEVFRRAGSLAHDAPLEWTGNVPVRAARAFDDAGLDLLGVLRPDGVRP